MPFRPEATKKGNRDNAELIGGKERRAIIIVPYDRRWPEMFDRYASAIREALGDAALRIEHIGSTSVPGLVAKPIIDILLVVREPDDEQTYIPALFSLGYQLRVREPGFDGHRMLRTPGRDVHIHVFPPTSREIMRYLSFRDQLRVNRRDRSRYEETKRRLATRNWGDVNEYADAKSAVVESIIRKASREGGADRST